MKHRLFVLLVITVILLGIAAPVQAAADPDSAPQLAAMNIYRNLLETGDRLFVWKANIPYATPPDESVNYAYIWQLIDTDGVTELGSTVGYPYNDGGYGYNVYSLYFDAADAVTWGQVYTLKLVQNPAVYPAPKEWNYSVVAADYTSLTTQGDNQAALASKILQLAGELDNHWGLTTSTSLLLETEAGTVLSIYGESVFRGSIYGVQALAPAAFRILVGDIDVSDRTWSTAYADNLSAQFNGTWIEQAKTAGGTLWGVSYDLTSVIIAVILSCGLIGLNYWLSGESWMGFVDLAFALVFFPRLDMIPLTFTALICALFVIGLGKPVKEYL